MMYSTLEHKMAKDRFTKKIRKGLEILIVGLGGLSLAYNLTNIPSSNRREQQMAKELLNKLKIKEGVLSETKKKTLNDLRIEQEGLVVYQAGSGYTRNFTRDSTISGLLFEDPIMLRDQLSFCANHQGTKKDPFTGEEPGKIHHEFPGVVFRDKSTLFSACDTTALYLIGHKKYLDLTRDMSLRDQQKENIQKAVEYILMHLNEKDLFIEDPRFCEANSFALDITYWKDNIGGLPGRAWGSPEYPVVYTLAHIQNLAGLRCASKLLDSKDLEMKAENMKKAMEEKLYDQELGTFYVAIDKEGPVGGINSDSLHALFYLEPGDLSRKRLEELVRSSTILETSIGYKTFVNPNYTAVWPFEQAMIHIGAKKFNLNHVEEVSSRVTKVLPDTDCELLTIKIRHEGADIELWTLAAKKYFQTLQLPSPFALNK